MLPGWMDMREVSFNSVLLLERVQLSWLDGWLPEAELGIALHANPVVAWYMQHKCPEIAAWIDKVLANAEPVTNPDIIRAAEVKLLVSMMDLITYAVDPDAYDKQPFLTWDSRELTSLADFKGKLVADIGSGTGRLAFTVVGDAKAVFAVEPVANLRYYLREKAAKLGFDNVYPIDGLITRIPFPDDHLDIVMSGHVFGDAHEEEYAELMRVTRPGGMIVLCPAERDRDSEQHVFLVEHGFNWGRFEEPGDGIKRKYWKTLPNA